MEKYIMVIDDEPQIANLVSGMVNRIGHATMTFVDSKEAISSYRDNYNNIAMVITDLSMKGATGLDVIRQVLGVNPCESILVITGLIRDNIKHLMESPNVEILPKPFILQELKEKIQLCILNKENRSNKM